LPGLSPGCSVATGREGVHDVAQLTPFPPEDFGDRYAIERELGHGAMATVYLARDRKFEEKLVAIKVLSPEFALAVPSERFLREIQTTAKLNHPHIVTLIDSGRTRGERPRPFYVMRYIEGEVLSDIIGRGPLAVGDALRIARQAAGALTYAHRLGVIHRDIKPGNIMVEDGHTWVTDFGIARAMEVTDRNAVTSTGGTPGTPAYMSPEQIMGHDDLDVRTDIYSLGCVLYEMLAGHRPFDGPNVQAVLNKHLVEPLPPIRGFRPEIPERLEQVVSMALGKNREDRFATVADLADALARDDTGHFTPPRTDPVRRPQPPSMRWPPPRITTAAAVLIGLAIVGVAVFWPAPLRPERLFIAARWDYGVGVDASMDAGRLLQDELNKWKGITVVGTTDSQTTRLPAAAARRAQAGRYVTGGVSRVGDSLRVRAALYDTREDTPLRERTVNLSLALTNADVGLARLADQLLFDDSVWDANGGRVETRSVAARGAFARGLEEVQRWSLVHADSAFREAADSDPQFVNASLWLAQVRFWSGSAAPAWSSPLARAAVGRSRLATRDQQLLDALVAFGQGKSVAACGLWDALARDRAYDFAAWYGLATCLNGDRIVVRDRATQSGWRFRSSYARALTAYQRAFQLLPALHYSMRDDAFRAVRRLLLTGPNDLLEGFGQPPDTTRYLAQASWEGDSLVVVPFPARWVWDRDPRAVPRHGTSAIRHQRQFFHDLTTTWVTAYPRSAEAVAALAVALELLNDPAALDTLRRARALATDPSERLRIAGAEVWMQLKYALPADLRGVRAARALADSLLAAYPATSGPDPLLFTSLAVLTGQAALAAQLARRAGVNGQWSLPPIIARSAPAFTAFAALGGPADSLEALAAEVRAELNGLDGSERQRASLDWLARPVTLAFPDYRIALVRTLAGEGYGLLDAQAAFLGGDTAGARRILDVAALGRLSIAPEDRTIDVLFPEASLRAALGDVRGAVAWLDPTLNVLAKTPPQSLSEPTRAGSLIRAMALRARLAALLHDSAGAALWSKPLAILRN
jgi:tetratricopeptide (TPR) repeat protein